MVPFLEEFLRYRKLLEGAVRQVSEPDFFRKIGKSDNSIAVIVQHLSGNFRSRFTEFLTSDGEKPWRNREDEFSPPQQTRARIMQQWQEAWQIWEETMAALSSEDRYKQVTIRGVAFTVEEALARSLAHFSYHVGQITYLAKHFAGERWEYLSIPPGRSKAYNRNPDRERGG